MTINGRNVQVKQFWHFAVEVSSPVILMFFFVAEKCQSDLLSFEALHNGFTNISLSAFFYRFN